MVPFFNKPDEDLQYIGRKFVNKTIALKNFKINNHQDISRAFNILHYNNLLTYHFEGLHFFLKIKSPPPKKKNKKKKKKTYKSDGTTAKASSSHPRAKYALHFHGKGHELIQFGARHLIVITENGHIIVTIRRKKHHREPKTQAKKKSYFTPHSHH